MKSSYWRLSRLLFCLATTLFVGSTMYLSEKVKTAYAQCLRLTNRGNNHCPTITQRACNAQCNNNWLVVR